MIFNIFANYVYCVHIYIYIYIYIDDKQGIVFLFPSVIVNPNPYWSTPTAR